MENRYYLILIIVIIMHFVRNGEECNLHKTMWYEVGLKLAYIGTNNVREE